MSEVEHHLERAEHAQHAALNPFDRRVTMTIAIIAVMLASVTLLSHRAHNETLELAVLANDNLTLASNKWNYFQAKKNRLYQYQSAIDIVGVLAKDPSKNPDEKANQWKGKVETYQGDTEAIQKEAQEFDELAMEMKSHGKHMHHVSDRYDFAELSVQIALVLCSIAVLTKRTSFWYAAMAFAVFGMIVTLTGLYMQYGSHSG
jgi:hypothetical protein